MSVARASRRPPARRRPKLWADGKSNRGKSVAKNTKGLKRGGSPGRPKGVPNRATTEAKEMCSRIVDDPGYFKRLKARALAGKLPPPVECMLWHYAKGKPKESVELSGGIDVNASSSAIQEKVRQMSDEDLKAYDDMTRKQEALLEKAGRGKT
jgi:hypothetical protein